MWQEILIGLQAAAEFAATADLAIRSVGVDCWGVDWALLDPAGELAGMPHAYRDPRNLAAFQRVSEKIKPREIYEITGIQVMPINSLYSLNAMASISPSLVKSAARLLFLPDLMHYWLSGTQVNEATIASTSQLLEARSGDWSQRLLKLAGVGEQCVRPIVEPGTAIGNLRDEVGRATGLRGDVQVILPPSHDTAAAVAAIPADATSSWCYLSSGTWSLLGAEITEPCLTDEAARFMFTNERGVAGTTRFLKNIAGLWLVQQCRHEFASRDVDRDYTYDELTEMAELAEPFRTLVNPDAPDFAVPGKVLDKIESFALSTDQPVPETPGDFLRCCLESLAMAYRVTLERLESTLARRFEIIHLVGGGCRNRLLCQMTADATGRQIIAGPVEAAAIGNALVQAMGDGAVADLRTLRRIVRETETLQTWQPASSGDWDQHIARFSRLINR